MNLDNLAEEMKEMAKAMPLTEATMDEIIASGGHFPEELQKNIVIDNVPIHIQFSHDIGPNNTCLKHLSFSCLNTTRPSEAIQEALRKAFFGEEAVLQLPSFSKSHVVHMMTKKGNPFNVPSKKNIPEPSMN